MFNRIIWSVLISVCVPLYAYSEEGGLPAELAELSARVTQLESQVEALLTQLDTHSAIAAAHHIPESIAVPLLEDLLNGVSRYTDEFGNETLQFSGMNVQIVNGIYQTDSTNGTGNLIIGYNESRETLGDPMDCPDGFYCDRRGGSHMLVIGKWNNYTSFGGMVVGNRNETSGVYASVSSGMRNLANGDHASVRGGHVNTASGNNASVSGGALNLANGHYASVSGGSSNTANGFTSSVNSGAGNTASGSNASVSGGANNEASGISASISGGQYNEASGYLSSVNGGNSKTASTDYCVVGDNGEDC